MASNKPETSGPAFGRSPKPYQPGTTEVELPNVPAKPMTPVQNDAKAEAKVVDAGDSEPHPEHVAGKTAVEHFEKKRAAEVEAGTKAVTQHPHRHK